MNQALVLNAMIVTVIGICLVVLQNPLALFGLLLLKDMPYGLIHRREELPPEDEDEPEPRTIGFI